MRSRSLSAQRWAAPAAVALALCVGTPALASSAAAQPRAPLAPAAATSAASSAATAGVARVQASSRLLDVSMQAQQYSNWCWSASGNTVAAFYGYRYSQNQFCNLAFGRSMNSSCPNSQATLANDQRAYRQMGISPGRYVNGYLSYAGVGSEVDAGRPVMTRVQWSSGGGHMMLLYGYDTSRQWVYWGDPWPSSSRYNWASWGYYVNNSGFSWTHSLYGIGA